MTRATALLVAALLALTGCAAAPATLPDGVTVSVFQTRFDGALRQVQIRVENLSAEPITVSSATLESSRFDEPAAFERPQSVPVGSARDLPIVLGAPACDSGEARDAVVLEFERSDGATGSTAVELGATDIINAINDKDCLELAVASLARIVPPAGAAWTPGAHSPAVLDLTVVPSGEPGTLQVESAGNTPLFSLVTPDGDRVTELPIGSEISADSGMMLLRLRVEPSRCDPHAIAEDKQGTHFPLDVSTSTGRSGRIVITVSDEVRSSLYDYVADYCGMPR